MTCYRMNWIARLDRDHPGWMDYLPLMGALDPETFPSCADLQGLLPPGLRTVSGKPVRFESQDLLPAAPYEQRIHETGVVSTRPGNWHDLFNALVWARLPSVKRSMNALHCTAPEPPGPGSRGARRDALTLFDECGVIVACTDPSLLSALAQRDWRRAFHGGREAWFRDATLLVAGHAMLEKFLDPYKAMTANALLVHVDDAFSALPREGRLRMLDAGLAERMMAGEVLARPRDLSPLPLAGIPGWWSAARQDAAFYGDAMVFRPPPEGAEPAPVHCLA